MPRRFILHPSSFILLLSLCFCFPATVHGQKAKEKEKANLRTSPPVLAAFRDVVARPSQSTVRVLCDGKDVALGAVVSADGWIITKFSELKDKPLCKLKDGRELEAKLIGVHDKFDLAMLKIEATDLTPVDWADSKAAAVGHFVAAPGLGEEPVAVGVVSVSARNLPPQSGPPAPNPNSGYLGVSLDPSELNGKIDQVLPGSAAEKAGLKVNDRILSVSGQEIENAEALITLLQKYKPGESIELKVKRGDQELELKATLGKRPASATRGDVQNNLGSQLSNRRGGFPVILQHDTVIKPTDCGGPLVNLDGKTIGINIARAGRTESYAIPTEAVRPLLKELMSGKLAPKAKDEPKKPEPAKER